MASFMEVLQTSRQSQNSSTIAYTGSLFREIFSCRAANNEVQFVIGTINDGTLYLLGALMSSYFARKGRKLADS